MSDREFHIVLTEPFGAARLEHARRFGRVTLLNACDEVTVLQVIADCDALIIRTQTQVTRSILDHAARLKVIGRGGVGLDNIDLEAAKERGICVVHTPAASTEAVADLAVGLMVCIVRKLLTGDSMVRSGRFVEARKSLLGAEMGELTVGIVGLGRIGRAVARRCQHGFNSRVLYNDIVDPGALDFDAKSVTKDELYANSEVVSLHVPLTDRTRDLIDESSLVKFAESAVLINTARGAVVNSLALASALSDGSLAGAGLDVVEPEPLPVDHPLLIAPNTVFTPHLGARTHGSLGRMESVVEDVIGVLGGHAPRHPAY